MFLDDAELKTESWRLRHSPEAIRTLGVWRWKGMQRHLDRILALCVGKRVIDFGGADGPLGLGSIVVDTKGNNPSRLFFIDDPIDVIFTSHTIEHLTNPEVWLWEASTYMSPGGYIIAHVPAWTCTRWRHTEYSNPQQDQRHLHTFRLNADANAPKDAVAIDDIVGLRFTIELAEHCGDNSLMVIGRKT